MKRSNLIWRLVFIGIVAIVAVLIAAPSGPDINIGSFHYRLFIHQGLDLKGGVALTYSADLSKIPSDQQSAALNSLKSLVEDRVNSLGVSEPVIQLGKSGGTNTLLVELPGVANVDEAIQRIGQFPDLKFLDQDGNVIVSGADVQSAQVTFGDATSQNNTSSASILGAPQVNIKFKADGTKKFADATTTAAAANPKKQIAILLDGDVVQTAVVQAAITDGNAVISGGTFTLDTAKKLTAQLNEGALPVPVKIISEQTIQATLGNASLRQSLIAGLVGFLLVALFMILYYRLPGFLAVIALCLYTIINIALYKIIPHYTLTLAGIAGFVLSIGMAVDANILIFERMREELAKGKPLPQAVDEGFKRAWTSIRDSNISTLLTAIILYMGTAGLIKGFALTLAIGVLVSLFSAITVTQTLLRLAINSPWRKGIHA